MLPDFFYPPQCAQNELRKRILKRFRKEEIEIEQEKDAPVHTFHL
jgi:hypothetical protein